MVKLILILLFLATTICSIQLQTAAVPHLRLIHTLVRLSHLSAEIGTNMGPALLRDATAAAYHQEHSKMGAACSHRGVGQLETRILITRLLTVLQLMLALLARPSVQTVLPQVLTMKMNSFNELV